jgi:hypothetical protein
MFDNSVLPPFEWINKNYEVAAEYGKEISFDGRFGVIVKDMGNYIGVNFYDDKNTVILPLHPTHKVEYLGKGKIRPLTRSQKRYQSYLEVSDCFDSFRQYLNYIKHNK